MRLTRDQYRRGVVKWRANGEATVLLVGRTSESTVASSPMIDPNGSVPDIVPERGGSVVFWPSSADALSGPIQTAWDRLGENEIETLIWDSDTGELALAGIPAMGQFDRLVVSVPYLQWQNDPVVRTGDVVARFTDHVVLERPEQESTVHGESASTFTFAVSTHRLDGSLIEIIAPQQIGRDREIAFAVLALLALVVGDAAVGDIVQLDPLASTPAGTEYNVGFPQYAVPSAANRTLRMRRLVSDEDLEAFDHLLAEVLRVDALREDVVLPLRWYERALRTGNEVDRFLAAFVGLEALVTRRAKRLGFASPIAELLAEPLVPELLAPLRTKYPDDQVDRLLSRLRDKNPSLLDRFERVAKELSLVQEIPTFRTAFKGRHPLVHGGQGAVDDGLPKSTVELLATMLRAVLVQAA